jgi:hypothetical protein
MRGQMTHLDTEVLAEFRAGLITGRDGARISAHLAGCAHCAGLCDQLAEVSALLAAVPAPALPDALAQRLDGVLAAEAAKRDYSERTVDDSPGNRASSPRPRRHWDFRLVAMRVLAPAAAVAVLAAGGYSLSRIGAGSSSSEAATSSSAGSAVSSAVSSAGAAAAPKAGALSAAGPSTGPTARHSMVPAFEAPVKFGVVTSQTNYLRATLRQQLERELQLYPRVLGYAQQLAPGPVQGCVLRVTGGTASLALVEKARFQGQPAIVIVANGRHDAAWVAAANCSSTSAPILATTTLPGTSAS